MFTTVLIFPVTVSWVINRMSQFCLKHNCSSNSWFSKRPLGVPVREGPQSVTFPSSPRDPFSYLSAELWESFRKFPCYCLSSAIVSVCYKALTVSSSRDWHPSFVQEKLLEPYSVTRVTRWQQPSQTCHWAECQSNGGFFFSFVHELHFTAADSKPFSTFA